MFRYINALHPVFEHQVVAAVGVEDGKYKALITDFRLVLIEDVSVEGKAVDAPFQYVPVPDTLELGKFDIQFDAEAGCFTFPPDAVMKEPTVVLDELKKPGADVGAFINTIGGVVAGMKLFPLPSMLSNLTQKWAVIHLVDGEVRMRTSDDYDALRTAAETVVGTCDLDQEHAFAVPGDIIALCMQNDEKVVSGFQVKGHTYFFMIKTPEFMAVYGCKPLQLEEPDVVDENATPEPENPGTPENEPLQQEGESAPEEQAAAEEPEEQPAAEPMEQCAEEPTDGTDAQAAEVGADTPEESAEEPGSSQSPGSGEPAPKPQADDYDVQEALDVLLPDLVKGVKDLTHANSVEMAKILKNIAKQVRKQMGRKADPSELAEIQAKLVDANKRADAAEAVLDGVRGELEPMKSVLNIKTKGFWK